MQIRTLPKDYLREKFFRLALFEAPVLLLAVLCFSGAIPLPNGTAIGLGVMFAATVGSAIHVWRMCCRLRCEECGKIIRGNPKDGWFCADCNIKYQLPPKNQP